MELEKTAITKNIIEEYADLELVGILYNTSYGGFSFSKKFIEILNERRKEANIKPIKSLYYDQRKDPMAVALFQELGSKESSGRHANIEIDWVPKEFQDSATISEYDGDESVCIHNDAFYANLLRKFLSDWKEKPELKVEDLDREYTRLKNKFDRYSEFSSKLYSALYSNEVSENKTEKTERADAVKNEE